MYGLVRPLPWETLGYGSHSRYHGTSVLGLVHMGSQVLIPKSLEVNPCKLDCREHGSWNIPLHMHGVPSVT